MIVKEEEVKLKYEKPMIRSERIEVGTFALCTCSGSDPNTIGGIAVSNLFG